MLTITAAITSDLITVEESRKLPDDDGRRILFVQQRLAIAHGDLCFPDRATANTDALLRRMEKLPIPG